VVAEIEDVFERVAGCGLEFGGVVRDDVGFVAVVGIADQSPVGELELVQVRKIPARERGLDRVRELFEGVSGP
jgi:hypothetical protein